MPLPERMRRHLLKHAPHIRLDAVVRVGDVAPRLPATGEEAEFDVLLLDAGPHPADALELVRRIRLERLLQLPVVMMAGRESEELASSALHLGVDDYLVQHEGYLFELPSTLEKVHRRAELAREERRLRDTNQRMAQLLASSPTIVYSLRVLDGTAHATWVSENVGRILGYSIAEAMQPGWWIDHLHPQDRDRAISGMGLLMRTGHLSHEYRFRCGDGREIWVRDELRRVSEADAAVAEIVGSWTDITADKRASMRASAAESRVPVLRVPLNSMCSSTCATPEAPSTSSIEPTRSHTMCTTVGARRSGRTISVMPLDRVNCCATVAGGVCAPAAGSSKKDRVRAPRSRFIE